MTYKSRKQWIVANAQAAKEATSGSRIFPSVLLAAAIVESSANVNGTYIPGQSLLAKNYNNYFGIKTSPQWKGKTVTLQTGEVVNGKRVVVPGTFRVYDSPKDSFADYVAFLNTNNRYFINGVHSAASAEIQADRIAAAGYATDPNYSNLLKSIIKSINNVKPSVFPVALVIGGIVAFYLIFKN